MYMISLGSSISLLYHARLTALSLHILVYPKLISSNQERSNVQGVVGLAGLATPMVRQSLILIPESVKSIVTY